MLKPTERFSDRVANYLKFRPSYPPELIETLITECRLNDHSAIADIGSGTGKFTELLLQNGLHVTAVEPNKEMRNAAEKLLSANAGFASKDGESAATGLAGNSVDLITAAQAFHWFDLNQTKQEFARILKPEGKIALIWNQRRTDLSFQQAYDEMLLRYAPEYGKVNHRNISDDDIEAFCHPRTIKLFSFAYCQKFDFPAFIGRMKSSSYTPQDGTQDLIKLTDAAQQLFEKYQRDGSIDFEYETRLYLA